MHSFKMQVKDPFYTTKELSDDFLDYRGTIQFSGQPVAHIDEEAVLLLWPTQEVRRFTYCARLVPFIKIDQSVFKISRRFTSSLIAEWGSRFFGAPADRDRRTYVAQAIRQYFGFYVSHEDLVKAITYPDQFREAGYPLGDSLVEPGKDQSALTSFPSFYAVNGLWSNHCYMLTPERNPLQLLLDEFHLYLEAKLDDQHRDNLLGLCVRQFSRNKRLLHSWFIPKHAWDWFFYKPEKHYFLTESEMWKFLPPYAGERNQEKSLNDALNDLAWSKDPRLSAVELEKVILLLSEMTPDVVKVRLSHPVLARLLVSDEPLATVLGEMNDKIAQFYLYHTN